MPESMIRCIDNLSRNKNCSKNTIIKLAVAKFLFNQDLPNPEISKNEHRGTEVQSDDAICEEIPIDKIVSVQYTLSDGRVIHIIRQSKLH